MKFTFEAAAFPPPVPSGVVATYPPAPPPAPVPAPIEEKYEHAGQVYTKSQLLAFPGWTEAHLAGLKQV